MEGRAADPPHSELELGFLFTQGVRARARRFDLAQIEARRHSALLHAPEADEWCGARVAEFLAGRELSLELLAEIGVSSTSIGRGDRGQPLFPGGTSGSISHSVASASWVAVAVGAQEQALGVDIECWGRLRPGGERIFLAQSEEVHLREAAFSAGIEQAKLGVLAFSAKEAAYKCIFMARGLTVTLTALQLSLEAWLEGHALGRLGRFVVTLPASTGAPPLSGSYLLRDEFVFCCCQTTMQ